MPNLIASTLALSLVASAPLPTPRVVGLVAAVPAAQPEETDPVMRVYDLRELQSYAAIQGAGTPHERLQELVNRIGEAAEAEAWNELIDGVFAVWGAPRSHDRMDQLIETVRELFNDRYAVSVACYVPTTEIGMSVGEAFADDEGSHFALKTHIEQSIFGGGPVRLASTVRTQYIGSWMPIVGNSALAYQPSIEDEMEGLETTVLVGDAPGGLVRVELDGVYRDLGLRTLNFEEGAAAGLVLELVDLYELELDANLVIKPGVPTVAISNERMIVVVTVRPSDGE